MKKISPIFLIPMMCLCSCSGFKPYGVYEFRLGKTDSAHFGLTAELKEEDNEKHEGYKNMTLGFDLGSEIPFDQMTDDATEDNPLAGDVVQSILKLLPDDKTIPGYYSVLNDVKNEKYGYRVKIGTDFFEELVAEYLPDPSIIEGVTELVSPDIIERIACAYVSDKQFTIQIPVAKDDILQQLTWYGLMIDVSANSIFTVLDESKLPGPEGEARIGVHPAVTKDQKGNVISNEVEMMNEAFEFEFSRTYLYQKNSEGHEEAVGSFVTKLNEDGKKVLFFSPFEDMTLASISGQVKVKSTLGEEYKDIKFSASKHTCEAIVDYNDKKGDEEGFKDAGGNEFTFKTLMKDPFVFRDFHDVKVGLTKI